MIILRLQGLPWSATAKDIRQHFEGLSIPDGGVHIIGGEEGDVFIAFATDDDARKAMQQQKKPLNGSRIILLLSSKAEMQEVIAESRAAAQIRKTDPFGTATAPALAPAPMIMPPVLPADQRSIHSREGSMTSSHSQSFQGYPQSDDQRGGSATVQAGSYQGGNVSARSQSYTSQGYDSSYPLTQGYQGSQFDQSQNRMYRDDKFQDGSSGDKTAARGGGDDAMFGQAYRYGQYVEPERSMSTQRRPEAIETSQTPAKIFEYQKEPTQYENYSRFSVHEGQRSSGDVEDRQYRSDTYDTSSNSWVADRDRSFHQRNEKPRTLLADPGMMRPNERSSQEPFDEQMEGFSTSYPPTDPADSFGGSQLVDEDQRSRIPQQGEGFGARQLSDTQLPMSGYGRENQSSNRLKEVEKGRYSQTRYGDEYWVSDESPSTAPSHLLQGRKYDDLTASTAPSHLLQGRKYDDLTPSTAPSHLMQGRKYDDLSKEEFKHEMQGRDDNFFNQRSEDKDNGNQLRRGFSDNTQSFGSSNQDYGSYYDQKNQSPGSFESGAFRSGEYSAQAKPSDFNSRMGNVPLRDQMDTGDQPPSSTPPLIPSIMDDLISPNVSEDTMKTSKAPLMETMGEYQDTIDTQSFYGVRLTGLPFSCSERDIRQFLQGINIAPECVQIHYNARGHMAGTANVKLQKLQDVEEAMKRHRQYLGSRYIDVRPCLPSEWESKNQGATTREPSRRGRSRSPIRGKRSPLRSSNNCIEMKGLSSSNKDVDILNFFEGLKVKHNGVFFEKSKDGLSNGVAYVEFVDTDNARKASQKNGRQLGRRSVAIRIISKEILDAKISNEMKRKVDRRSPPKRSPDRRRGSSPHIKRGRSPGRRARSSPGRNSNRSSPGRNGPGRRPASPARDKDSSHSTRRGHSPTRHGSQDRRDVLTDKKDRKEQDTKDNTTAAKLVGKGEDIKPRRSPGSQDRDQSHRSGDAKQSSSLPLLPHPDPKKVHQDEPVNLQPEARRGLLQTPDQTNIEDSHEPHHDQSKGLSGISPSSGPESGIPFGAHRPDHDMADPRRHGQDFESRFGFHSNRDEDSRREPMDWQHEESRRLIERRRDGRYPDEHIDNRQRSTDDPQGVPRGSRGGPTRKDDGFPIFTDRRRLATENRREGLIDDMWRGNVDERPSGLLDSRLGSSGDDRRAGPRDERNSGPMSAAQRGRPIMDNWPGAGSKNLPGGPRDVRQVGIMDERAGESRHNIRGGPVGDMRSGYMDDKEDPMGRRYVDDRRHRPADDRHSEQGDHPSGKRRALLDRPPSDEIDEFPVGQMEDEDIDRRGQGLLGSREGDHMTERIQSAMHRRNHSAGEQIDFRQGDRMERRGPNFQDPGPQGSGPDGNSLADDRGPNFRDRRNVPSSRSENRFPTGGKIPGLLDPDGPLNMGRMDRNDHENRGHRDPPVPMDRQFGSQERRDHRSLDRRGPEDESVFHKEMGPQHGDHGRQSGEGEYVCAHVRNMPYQVRWPEIAQFFSGLQIVPGGIHIMVTPEGKPSGHCFIELADPHQARLTEERRLHTMRDRVLHINACSKTMMLRALEQSGELPQSVHPSQFGQRGRGQPFGPRGPRGPGFQGHPRGSFPGPRGPFGPRGPHHGPPGPYHGHFGPRGPPFRPPFGDSRERGGHLPPHHSERPQHTERSGEDRPPAQSDTKQEAAKPDQPSKNEDTASKIDAKQTPKKIEPEAKKEIAPEAKKVPTPSPTPSPVRVPYEKHKGCVVSATNLPLTITVDAIMDFFKGFSTIKGAIRLDTNEATGKATGQAKIVFSTSTEANRAIKERNNRPLNGRIVRLHVV